MFRLVKQGCEVGALVGVKNFERLELDLGVGIEKKRRSESKSGVRVGQIF